MKNILVCGAGGFIGTHLVESLRRQGHQVIGADLKFPPYSETQCHKFYKLDLRDRLSVQTIFANPIDEIYQLAADMGGAGYISTGNHDADIMHNSAVINLNILDAMRKHCVPKVFYSSTACVYPAYNQTNTDHVMLSEHSVYPADPDSEYGWEKLFSERLYLSYARNHGIDARIARLHNVFGPRGNWNNGKEKAPAALCRKVAMCNNNGTIEVWGPGVQTRSFLYIDQCIEGIHRIMASDCREPLNLGSTSMISINDLVKLIAKVAKKTIHIKNVDGPMGVMGRNSDNRLIKEKINWAPGEDLEGGLIQTYAWIKQQLDKKIPDSE
jgi:nucleoside-diphosphate-sugar epimerase